MTTKQNQKDFRLELGNFKHKAYERVKTYVTLRENIWMYGEAGTGKNYTAEQIARDLGLEFYMVAKAENKSDLEGYCDAMGKYHPSQLYHAVTKGGVFLFDEIDMSEPDAVGVANALLANGKFTFPGHDLPTPIHPDFVFLAGANSNGHTHDDKYTARATLDAATLTRFVMVKFGYDTALEELIYKDAVAKLEGTEDEIRKKSLALALAFKNFNKTRELSIDYDDGLIVSTRALTKILRIVSKSDIPQSDIWDEVIFNGREFKKKYAQDLDSSSFDVELQAGQLLRREAKDWSPRVSQKAEWVDTLINGAQTFDDLTLAEYLNDKVDGGTAHASLLNIKIEDMKSAILGALGVIWKLDSDPKFHNSAILISEYRGKLSAKMVSGSSVTNSIKEGEYIVLAWHGKNLQGIVLDAGAANGTDSRVTSLAGIIEG